MHASAAQADSLGLPMDGVSDRLHPEIFYHYNQGFPIIVAIWTQKKGMWEFCISCQHLESGNRGANSLIHLLLAYLGSTDESVIINFSCFKLLP